MKILLTGSVQSFADKKGTVVLEALRKAKDGPAVETFYLKFHSDESYQAFKGRYALGDGVQVIGLLRQVPVPIVDRVTKKPIQGSNGRDLRNSLLAVEVKEHKAVQRDELDTLYAHGIVSIVEKRELAKSASGLSYLKARVAYNHYKRPDEEQGQADFYNLVCFGGQAESLDNLEKGQRFVIDYAVPSLDSYDMRDVAHSDGTPISRNGLELLVREFSFLPRSAQSPDVPMSARAPEEIPF
ncbi:MAG: hypothetical protein JWM80_221 [Cyanobacteria bacterium RYN_339]|nr:hypothetical protein [Cyanobacteria bacterium RYN_339]